MLGGENRTKEKARLRKGVHILVATPGRLLDHLMNTSSFRAPQLEVMFLDEADRLLDMGFTESIRDILTKFEGMTQDAGTARFQRILCSATLHGELDRLVTMSLRQPVSVGFSVTEGDIGGGGLTVGPTSSPTGLGIGISLSLPTPTPSATPTDAANLVATNTNTNTNTNIKHHPLPPSTSSFSIPATLRQHVVEAPGKVRLASLLGYLRRIAGPSLSATKGATTTTTTTGSRGKVVVFVSTGDGVEFLYHILTEIWSVAYHESSMSSSTFIRNGGGGEGGRGRGRGRGRGGYRSHEEEEDDDDDDDDDNGVGVDHVRDVLEEVRRAQRSLRPTKNHKKAKLHHHDHLASLSHDANGRDKKHHSAGPCLGSLPIYKLHGSMPQAERSAHFLHFVRAKEAVLICTDVAARGLDFPLVSTIIQV